MFDNIIIGAPAWVLPAVIACAFLAAMVAWAYAKGTPSGLLRLTAAGLKLLAILALAACLVEPMLSSERPKPHANLIGIVVDNSQSMQMRSPGQTDNRSDRLAPILESDASWQTRLSQDFDVRRYAYDRSLRNVDDLKSLAFDGTASSLHASVETIATRFQKRPVAGLILMTDGNATDQLGAKMDWSRLAFPVYPVIEKAEEEFKDIRIAQLTTRQTDFEASPVTVSAKIASAGIAEPNVIVALVAEDGTLVEEKKIAVSDDGKLVDVEFRFRPKESGLQFYRVNVFPESERKRFEQGETRTEATVANNTRLVSIDRDKGPYRVLYVAGRPNWEFKFLRRALQEDDEVQLVALLRIARKEAKFSFRDRGVNTSNPLFSGFDPNEEEGAEQYDEPVILRYGIDESEELSRGFPKDADELFSYQAVILDDIEAAFFTQEQLLLLRQFVSARGGGLLLLGGTESFGKGKYDNTPLEDLMPVYLPRGKVDGITKPHRFELTREGWLQPWTRVRETEVAEKKRFTEMPEFSTINPVGEIKPGASLLAEVSSGDETQPALAVQRYGKGRSAAMLVGDLWRWGMRRESEGNRDLEQVWRQTVRWMISDVPKSIEVNLVEQNDASKPVAIEVMVRDSQFLPLDNAEVTLAIAKPDGKELKMTAEASDEQAGVYTANYWPGMEGAYRVNVSAAGPDGSEIGTHESGWVTETATAEFRDIEPNLEFLQRIAEESGGEVVSQDELLAFAKDLPNRKVPVMENWIHPLWHGPWMLLFALACLCGEWGIRRLNGLP